MKPSHKITLLFLILSVNVFAHRLQNAHVHAVDTLQPLVKAYVDSLNNYKSKLDSMQQVLGVYQGVSTQTNGKYSKLFLPMTFYHSITSQQFSLTDDILTPSGLSNEIDEALLNIYLHRPDLVTTTQTALEAEGKVSTSQSTTIKNKVDIVEKVPSVPQEVAIQPIDLVVKKPNFWKVSGDGYLQFLQNYISSNWYNGGESNYTMLANVTLLANYNNKQKFKWDNKLEMKLGFQTTQSDTLRSVKTSTDEIRYTGSVGLQASKHWYYTLQVIANTQLMRGYRNNKTTVFSDFTSPLDLTVSVGMDYNVNWLKGKLTGKIHLAPLAYNFRYVSRSHLFEQYGLNDGKHYRDDYGSDMNINLNWKFSDNISWKTRLYSYTSYKRVLIEWENTISFQFNKYISTNLYLYPRFDDSMKKDPKHGHFMYKEFLSFGLNYSF